MVSSFFGILTEKTITKFDLFCQGLICLMLAKHSNYVAQHSLYVLMTYGFFFFFHSVISKGTEIEFFQTGVNIIDIQYKQ